MEALTPIVVNAMVLVIGTLLTLALTAFRRYLKAKLTAEQYALLDRIADAAVWTVEQKGAGVFTNKKEAASQIVAAGLASEGLQDKFATHTIDAAIESNVATAFNYGKLTD